VHGQLSTSIPRTSSTGSVAIPTHIPSTALIADPSIDCIYNALPNGLHYIHTLAALKAGKHVLLEKPCVSNAEEARSLFRHPVLSAPNAPVLVEASHYRFHPAWHLFLSQFNKEDVEHAETRAAIPGGLFPGEDIRFDFNLAGGCSIDLGHYTLSALRGVFGTEPIEVTSATPRLIPEPYDQRCDQAMAATYLFPNGRTGAVSADIGAKGGYWFPWLTSNWPSFKDVIFIASVRVQLGAEDLGIENGMKISSQKEIVFWGFMLPHMYHRIDVTTTVTLRDPFSGAVVKESNEVKKMKAYTWAEGQGGENKGYAFWPTYRYQLEEFVNRIKGREGSGVWIEHEESIKQMVANDQTYAKAGLPLRPTTEKLE